MKAIIRIALVAVLGLGTPLLAKETDTSRLPPPSDRRGITYEKDIKPIFEESCVKCHGEKESKGKLRLDNLTGVLKGSENGSVVEPGKSSKSYLVINVARLGDPEDWMPPPENKFKIAPLSDQQIALIRAWIDQGAK